MARFGAFCIVFFCVVAVSGCGLPYDPRYNSPDASINSRAGLGLIGALGGRVVTDEDRYRDRGTTVPDQEGILIINKLNETLLIECGRSRSWSLGPGVSVDLPLKRYEYRRGVTCVAIRQGRQTDVQDRRTFGIEDYERGMIWEPQLYSRRR